MSGQDRSEEPYEPDRRPVSVEKVDPFLCIAEAASLRARSLRTEVEHNVIRYSWWSNRWEGLARLRHLLQVVTILPLRDGIVTRVRVARDKAYRVEVPATDLRQQRKRV